MYSSIYELIESNQINAKAAEVLGLSGALSSLEEDLNELEAGIYAKELVLYFRSLQDYKEKLAKYQERYQERRAKYQEKVDKRAKKTEERQQRHQEKLARWREEVKKKEEKNSRLASEGKKLLKIPEEPTPPKSLASVPEFKPPKEPEKPELPILPKKVLSQREKIHLQRDMLNMYVSGHPLDEVKEEKGIIPIRSIKESVASNQTDSDAPKKKKRKIVTIHGVLLSYKETTLRSKKLMARLRLEDKSGSIEVVAFSSLYTKVRDFLEKGQIYKVIGEVDGIKSSLDDQLNQAQAQLIGKKISIVRIASDKEWEIRYPLLKGSMRILPTKIQASQGIATNMITQYARS